MGRYLVMACKFDWNQGRSIVNREEFPGVTSAFAEARRLRAAGYAVTVLRPGSWA